MKTKIAALILGLVIFTITPFFSSIFSKNTDNSADTVRVYITKEKTVKEYPVDEYIFGVVGSEINMQAGIEALKAQAVVSRTYLLYKMEQKNDNMKYDITDSFETDQQFVPRKELIKKWGNKADDYAKNIDKAIKETALKRVVYNQKTAFTPYHSTSAGKTISAKNVWGKDYPYLQSVESVGDLLNPEYMSTVEISYDQFVKIANDLLKAKENDSEIISDISTDNSGMVLTCKIFGKKVSGRQIRSAFSLNSSVFEVSVNDKKTVTITVRGKGHGVGMSQYGAQIMAQQGSTFDEIIRWYYPGCEIK